MTLEQWQKLYDYYKNYYDFQLTKRSYRSLDDSFEEESDEWVPDSR